MNKKELQNKRRADSVKYHWAKLKKNKDLYAERCKNMSVPKINGVGNMHGFKEGHQPWNKGKKGAMPVPWNKGKPMSDATKKKVSEAKKRNPTRYWLGKKRPELHQIEGFDRTGKDPWNKDRKCENLAKENHWNWQGGKSHERHSFYFKKLSKKLREEGICVFCYIEEDLVVHHIDLNKHNNELINLQVLCRSCHSKLHSVLSPIKFRQEVEI